MKTPFYLVLILGFSLIHHLKSQEAPAQPPLVSVDGYGTANAPPDEVEIRLNIQLRDESADMLDKLINNRSSTVLQILHNANVADEDIEVSDVPIWPFYGGSSSRFGTPLPDYYEGKKAMIFTLKNASNYDAIIIELYDAGINSIESVVFQLSNNLLQATKMEARRNAAANLNDTLSSLVESLGLNIGHIYAVSESTYGGDPQPYYGYTNTRSAVIQAGEVAVVIEAGTEPDSDFSIAPDNFIITSTIYAKYYLV